MKVLSQNKSDILILSIFLAATWGQSGLTPLVPSAWAESFEVVTYFPAPKSPTGNAESNPRFESIRVGTLGWTGSINPYDGLAAIQDKLWIGTNYIDPMSSSRLHVVGPDDAAGTVTFMPGMDTAAVGTPSLNVGIGTTNPISRLHVVDESTTQNYTMSLYKYADNNNNELRFRRARGTPAAPTAVQTGNELGAVSFAGYVGAPVNDFTDSRAKIGAYAAENWTGSLNGAYMTFHTTPMGSTTMAERVRIDPDGYVGIGTNNPQYIVDVAGTTDPTSTVRIRRASTDNAAPTLDFSKSRGTLIVLTSVASGDQVGQIHFHGYDGSGYRDAADITASVDGTPAQTATDMPGRLVFSTTPNGSATLVERMRINNLGNVGIGNFSSTSISGRLHVKGEDDGPSIVTFMPGADTGAAGTPDIRVGIGTTAPSGRLHVVGQNDAVSQVLFMPGLDTGTPGIPDIRVGIGTTTPSEKLEINGNLKVNGAIIGRAWTILLAGNVAYSSPETTLVSVTVTSRGGTLVILGKMTNSRPVSTFGNNELRLYRDGFEIDRWITWVPNPSPGAGTESGVVLATETLAAGAHTYELRGYSLNGSRTALGGTYTRLTVTEF